MSAPCQKFPPRPAGLRQGRLAPEVERLLYFRLVKVVLERGLFRQHPELGERTVGKREACGLTGICKNTMQKYLKEGKVKAKKAEEGWQIPLREVALLNSERETTLTPKEAVAVTGLAEKKLRTLAKRGVLRELKNINGDACYSVACLVTPPGGQPSPVVQYLGKFGDRKMLGEPSQVTALARETGLCRSTIHRLKRRGWLRAERKGKNLVIPEKEWKKVLALGKERCSKEEAAAFLGLKDYRKINTLIKRGFLKAVCDASGREGVGIDGLLELESRGVLSFVYLSKGNRLRCYTLRNVCLQLGRRSLAETIQRLGLVKETYLSERVSAITRSEADLVQKTFILLGKQAKKFGMPLHVRARQYAKLARRWSEATKLSVRQCFYLLVLEGVSLDREGKLLPEETEKRVGLLNLANSVVPLEKLVNDKQPEEAVRKMLERMKAEISALPGTGDLAVSREDWLRVKKTRAGL